MRRGRRREGGRRATARSSVASGRHVRSPQTQPVANMQIRSAVALLIAAAVIAGGPTARARQQTTASRLVLATVTDAQNRVLADLGPDDFVVSENGELREVVAVFTADYPVIVLVDNSAEARSDFDAIRSAVNRFLSRVGERFVAVGTLADPPALLTSLEDDRSAVLARLDRMTAGPSSVLMPIEAVALAVQAVRENGSPFSAVVVVSAHSIDAAQPQNTPAASRHLRQRRGRARRQPTSPATAPRDAPTRRAARPTCCAILPTRPAAISRPCFQRRRTASP